MYLLGLGMVLLGLKLLGLGPVAAWDWWVVLMPLALAAIWWAWADASGYTRRKAMAREAQRRQARIDRSRAALGTKKKRS